MMCAAASTSAGGRCRAPNTPSSATMTTASMSTSPKPRGRRYARHPPPAPVEQRRRLGPERRVLERGVDPDAQHRRLVGVRGVVAAEPPAQRRSCPSARRASSTSGISDHRGPDGLHRARREDARELLLVPEVAVEGAVRDARGRDEVVDARVVVAAVDEHVASGREQRVERAVAGRVRVDRAVALGAARASRGRTRARAAAGRRAGARSRRRADRTTCDAGRR